MHNTQAVHTMDEAVRAQAAFVSEYTAQISTDGYGDDDIDYLPGALELLIALQADAYNAVSIGTGPASLNRDPSLPVSAEVAIESRKVIVTHGAYPGDYGPQSVFDFLGMPDGAV